MHLAIICHSDGSPANDGVHDICPYPSRFLLIRQLSKGAKTDAVYASLKNLNPHLKRVYFAKDQTVKSFLGYSFAEYTSIEACQATLALIATLPSFSLCGRPVEITFGRDLSLS